MTARGGDSDDVNSVSARASVSRAVSAGDGRGGFGGSGAWRGAGRRFAGVEFAEPRVAGRRVTGRFVILGEGFFDPGNGRAIYS